MLSYEDRPSIAELAAEAFSDNDMGTDNYGYCRNCKGGGVVPAGVDPYTGIDGGVDCPWCDGEGTRPIDTDTADAYDAREAAKRNPAPLTGMFPDPWAVAAQRAAEDRAWAGFRMPGDTDDAPVPF